MTGPVYEHAATGIFHVYPLATGNVLRFQATEVRRERTGTHARLNITVNWISLAWSNFNIDRDEDRVRLANSAYKHLEDDALDRAEFPLNRFKRALDLFCIGIWDEFVSVQAGGLMGGDPNLLPARPLLGSSYRQHELLRPVMPVRGLTGGPARERRDS